MKTSKIAILLLTPALALMCLAGCVRDRGEGNESTSDINSPLIPGPGATLPGEDGTTTPGVSDESVTTTDQSTTQKQETTKQTETTTEQTEASTTKATTTTTTTTKATTSASESTTKKPESATTTTTTTTATTSNSTSGSTTSGSTTSGSTTSGSTTSGSSTSGNTTSGSTTSGSTTSGTTGGSAGAPEVGAGEWLHFEEFKDDHAGAAAYLGRSKTELPVKGLIEHFGLPLSEEDITVIDRGDSEDADNDAWYLILPRYRDTVVRLREVKASGKRTTAGELIAEGMHPMLVRCDPEDGEPSVWVELIRNGETISFPLTREDSMGMPDFHDRMLDITPEGVADQMMKKR